MAKRADRNEREKRSEVENKPNEIGQQKPRQLVMRGNVIQMPESPQPVDPQLLVPATYNPATDFNPYTVAVSQETGNANHAEPDEIRTQPGTGQQGDQRIEEAKKGFRKAAMHGG